MKYYEGQQPCAGCGRTGAQFARDYKDKLCKDCKAIYDKGKTVNAIENIKYVRLFQHYYAFRREQVNDFVHEILAGLDVGIINPAPKMVDPIRHTMGSNGVGYTIPEGAFDPIRNACIKLNAAYDELSEEKKRIPEIVSKTIESERNDIYNEGIERGRNLLISLNRGEITNEQLTQTQVYAKQNSNR